MTLRFAIGLAALLTLAAAGVWSSVVLMSIVEDVNRTRTPSERISEFIWSPGKYEEVLAAYRTSVPAGRKHVRLLIAGALCFSVALVLAACLRLLPGMSP